MAARRVKMDRLLELVRLHRLGTGAREVARLLQMSPNTERRYREALQSAELLDGPVEPLPELGALKAALGLSSTASSSSRAADAAMRWSWVSPASGAASARPVWVAACRTSLRTWWTPCSQRFRSVNGSARSRGAFAASLATTEDFVPMFSARSRMR